MNDERMTAGAERAEEGGRDAMSVDWKGTATKLNLAADLQEQLLRGEIDRFEAYAPLEPGRARLAAFACSLMAEAPDAAMLERVANAAHKGLTATDDERSAGEWLRRLARAKREGA